MKKYLAIITLVRSNINSQMSRQKLIIQYVLIGSNSASSSFLEQSFIGKVGEHLFQLITQQVMQLQKHGVNHYQSWIFIHPVISCTKKIRRISN